MPARAWLAICVLLLVFTPARRALAHAVGLSNGDYRWQGQTLYADVSMSQRELAMLVPELDPDHDGMLEPEELTAATGALTRAVVGGIAVKADGTACSGVLDRALLLEGEAGVVVRARCARSHCHAPSCRCRSSASTWASRAGSSVFWPRFCR